MRKTVELVWIDDRTETYSDIEEILTSFSNPTITLYLPNGAYSVVYTHNLRYMNVTTEKDTV
jgi:hypothetical protein